MRVTLDTNVLVSAFISKQGHPALILDTIATFNEISLVLSEEILVELKDVLSRDEVIEQFHYSKKDIEEFIRAIREIASIINMQSSFAITEEDPKDDIILKTAYDGKADFLISGDRHVKKVKRFRGVRIVSPRQFMSIITKRFGELISSEENTK